MISFGVGTLGCQFSLRWKAKPILVFRQQTSFSLDTAHKTRAYFWLFFCYMRENPLKKRGSDHQMLSFLTPWSRHDNPRHEILARRWQLRRKRFYLILNRIWLLREKGSGQEQATEEKGVLASSWLLRKHRVWWGFGYWRKSFLVSSLATEDNQTLVTSWLPATEENCFGQ